MKRRCFIVCNLVLIIGIYVYIDFTWDHNKYFDSNYYWNMVSTFNIAAFPKTYKGYFYPYLIFLLKKIGTIFSRGGGNGVFILFNSIMASLTLTWIIPAIATGGHSEKIEIKRRVIGTIFLLFLLLWYWGDFIKYPLSDFPAMFFLGISICILIKIRNLCAMDKTKKRMIILIMLGVSEGVFIYITYSTRSTYLYAIIVMVALYAYEMVHRKKMIWLIFPILIGIFLAAYPQVKINYRDSRCFSAKVPTENFVGGNLQNWQLSQGLTYERFEGVLKNGDKQPEGGVKFQDEAGNLIAQQNDVDETMSIKKLVKLIIKYPLEFCGIYTRATVNYLTPLWNHVYIKDMFVSKMFNFVLNAILWIVAFGSLYLKKRTNFVSWITKEGWISLPFLIVCILMIVGAPEIRFFISGYFLMYGYIMFRMNIKEVKKEVQLHPFKVCSYCFGVFLLWTAIIGDTLSKSSIGTQIFVR